MKLDFTDASVTVHLGLRTEVEVKRDGISGVRVGPAPLISRLGTRWWWGATVVHVRRREDVVEVQLSPPVRMRSFFGFRVELRRLVLEVRDAAALGAELSAWAGLVVGQGG
ncbi:MAG: hypothetical protein JWN67_2344 [Actinomycetia bacterium]|nr:hypothetical protein [Actinomycetes bacterium]